MDTSGALARRGTDGGGTVLACYGAALRAVACCMLPSLLDQRRVATSLLQNTRMHDNNTQQNNRKRQIPLRTGR